MAEPTVSQTVKALKERLVPVYGEGETTAIIRLIFYHLKGWNTSEMIINSDTRLSPYVLGEIDKIEKRLMNHEPIQYITGDAYFYGLDLGVNPDVLIPRPETEELVDMIVKENTASDLKVLDVGTGSGAIAIALARNLDFPKVTALDISPEAIALAKKNAAKLKTDITFLTQDIFTFIPLPDSFDIIVSNPPYICESEKKDMDSNVLDYEPAQALFVPDDDPLRYYKRIADVASDALVAGGRLYFEINPLYCDKLIDMLSKKDFKNIESSRDIHGKKRFIKAEKR